MSTEPTFEPTERVTPILNLPLFGDADKPTWRGHVNYITERLDNEISVNRTLMGDLETQVTAKLTAQDERVTSRLDTFARSYSKANQTGYDPVLNDGLAPNVSTDSTATLTRAANAAVAAGLPLVIPAGTYRIGNWKLPEGLTLVGSGYGTVFTLHDSYAGANDVCMVLDGSHGVTIRNLSIDGDKDSFASSSSEWKHGISASNSNDVAIENVLITRCHGDGIYLGIGPNKTECKNVSLYNSILTGNHRNNLTIAAVNTFRCVNTSFTAAKGTAPEAGIDIEPNFTDDVHVVRDMSFTSCTISENNGAGLGIVMWDAVNQGGATFTACTIKRNKGVGVNFVGSKSIRFIGCDVIDNGDVGLRFTSNVMKAISVVDCTIARNGKHGVQGQPNTAAPPGRTETVLPIIDSIRLANCEIYDNGTLAPNTYYGVIFDAIRNPGGTNRIRITDTVVNNRETANQKFGIYIAANIGSVTIHDSDVRGNVSTGLVLLDDATTRNVHHVSGYATNLTVASATTLSDTVTDAYVSTAAGALTLTLPANPEPYRDYTVTDVAGKLNVAPVTVTPNSSGVAQRMASNADVVMNVPYQTIRFVFRNGVWYSR